MSFLDQIDQELKRIRAAGGSGTLTADAPSGRLESLPV